MLRTLRGTMQLTNGEIARRGDVTRGYIESKSCGATAIDLEDIEILAIAFGVEEHVFLMEPSSALRWVLDNVPAGGLTAPPVGGQKAHADLHISPSPCKPKYARRSPNRPRLVAFARKAA